MKGIKRPSPKESLCTYAPMTSASATEKEKPGNLSIFRCSCVKRYHNLPRASTMTSPLRKLDARTLTP